MSFTVIVSYLTKIFISITKILHREIKENELIISIICKQVLFRHIDFILTNNPIDKIF